jgi:predicted  nucleic acid-binding Zn-ribbon protein
MTKLSNKFMKVVLIAFLSMGFAFTVQAKKKPKSEGPSIEVCRTKKNGEVKCKTTVLHGTIAVIYDLLLEQNDAIAANATIIAELSVITEDLRSEINALIETVNDHEGRIATNENEIASILVEIADLQAIQVGHTQELQDLRTSLSQLGNYTVAQIDAIKDQAINIQGKIDANHAEMIALFADLNIVLAAQKAELENLINTEIADLEAEVDAQIALLKEKVDEVKAELSTMATVADLALTNLQVTLILADIQDLKSDLGDLQDTADDLAGNIADNEGLISDLNADIDANEAAIVALLASLAALDARIAPLEAFHQQANEITITETAARDTPNNDFIKNFLASFSDLSSNTYLGISGRNNASGHIVEHCIADAERLLVWMNNEEWIKGNPINKDGSYARETGTAWLPLNKLEHFNQKHFWFRSYQTTGNLTNMGIYTLSTIGDSRELHVEGEALGTTITYRLGNSIQETCGFTP